MGAEKILRCISGLIKGDHAQAEAGGLACLAANGYLSLLVEIGMFDLIKMTFLPVGHGHTHEDVDQAF